MDTNWIATLASLVGMAAIWFIKSMMKDKSSKSAAMLHFGVELAYNIVNEISIRTETKIDDKVAMGLSILKDWLSAHGQTMTAVDEQKAKLLFQAMHGKELIGG